MTKQTMITGIVMDEDTVFSWVEVCEECDISEDVLWDILEHGLSSTHAAPLQQLSFDRQMLDKIRAVRRLQHDLGLNSAGAVLVLELLDELEDVQQELAVLRRQLG